MNTALPYDTKLIFKCLGTIGVVMALMIPTKGVGFLAVLPFIFLAMQRSNPEKMLLWLLILIMTLVTNSVLMPKSSGFYVIQRCVMLVMAGVAVIQLSGARRDAVMAPFAGLLIYALYMIIPSSFGWAPIVSFLKLILFGITYFAYYGMAVRISQGRRYDVKAIRSVFLSVAIFFIFGSMLSIPFPAISMMRYEQLRELGSSLSLFQGVSGHSQCLGPVVVMLAIALFSDLVFSIRRWDRLYVALLLCAPYLIFRTSSRTAMGSLIAGVGILTLILLHARGMNGRWRGKVVSVLTSLIIFGSMAVLVVPSIRDGATRFIVKWGGGSHSSRVTMEDITKSRQGLVDGAMANFRKKPLIGNGFQVSEEMSYVKYDSTLKLLTAPVEKGVWFAAILEEGGAAGMFIFVIFSLVAFVSSIKKRAYTGATLFFVMLMTNLGEFTIFSMSYLGGFAWGIVFVGLTIDSLRLRSERETRFMPF